MNREVARTATVTMDAATVSPSKALAATARLAPLVVVTGRAYGEMLAELGDAEAVIAHLVRVATNVGKPLAVNLPSGPDTSSTIFLGPKGWSEERVMGWAAGSRRDVGAAVPPGHAGADGGFVSDERRVPNHDERDAIIIEAKKEGGICAACGRVLAADEPVWRERLVSRAAWSSYFGPAHRWALVGRECATPEILEANEGQEPVACLGCARGIHYAGGPASRRSTVCSVRCRVTMYRRRSKGGQPS